MNDHIYWYGCYRVSRSADDPLTTASSIQHPAKMSPGLLQHIRRFGEERAWWKPGDSIIDSFGSIGTTGLLRLHGYNTILVELEERFVRSAQENMAILDRKAAWVKKLGLSRVIQGDSRRLAELLGIETEAAVTSPPYGDSMTRGGHLVWRDQGKFQAHKQSEGLDEIYGNSDGQIGNLPDRPDAAVTSPPYGHPAKGLTEDEYAKKQAIINRGRLERGEIKGGIGRSGALGRSQLGEGYGDSDAQIGNLPDRPDAAVTSPPWVVQTGGMSGERLPDEGLIERQGGGKQKCLGKTEGQIQNLPDAALTSPPYAGTLGQSYDGDVQKSIEREERYQKEHPEYKRPSPLAYSGQATNVENLPDEQTRWQRSHRQRDDAAYPGHSFENTYQGAMLACYRELHRCLKPGGVACVVTKNPTRGGKLRRLDLDTATLLLMAGFRLWCPVCERWDDSIHWHPDPELEPVIGYRAVLAQQMEQATLFGKIERSLKGRASFFKRLSWQKGSAIALWEDVIFSRKPSA